MENSGQIRRRVGKTVAEKIGVQPANEKTVVEAKCKLASQAYAADVAQRLADHRRALAFEQFVRHNLDAARHVADRRSSLVARSPKPQPRRAIAGKGRRSDFIGRRQFGRRRDHGNYRRMRPVRMRLFGLGRLDVNRRQIDRRRTRLIHLKDYAARYQANDEDTGASINKPPAPNFRTSHDTRPRTSRRTKQTQTAADQRGRAARPRTKDLGQIFWRRSALL